MMGNMLGSRCRAQIAAADRPCTSQAEMYACDLSRSAAPSTTGPATFGAAQPRPARTGGDDVVKTVRREEPKVGRNDPCPCGSGKKYKKCHGQAA